MTTPETGRRRLLATAAGLSVGCAAYFLSLFDYATDPLRRAHPLGYASNFFDYQARAFLDGHLWVQPGALGIEAFVEDGREYMYFGPFPALLRLPVLLTTHEYDGRLTLLSMALAFVLLAVVTTHLAWLVRDSVRGADLPLSRFEATSMAVFLALATGGTVLTFNASLPWAYHEVYAWSVPLVLGAMYWMVRVRTDASRTAVRWLFLFCVCAILTRTTGGWAVCLTSIGLGLWLLAGRRDRALPASYAWRVVAAGAVALVVGITFNLLKFRHPYLFPLEDQVWTELNARRREALEVNGGTITGPQFFWTSLVNYFRPDGIRFVDYFPWITLPAGPARPVGGAFLDQSYRTGSVTAFMPLLLALTVLAVPVAFRPRATEAVRRLRAPFVAGVLTTGGVMAYGYVAHRYTAEFVPALVIGGAIGICAVNAFVADRGPVWRGAVLLVAGATTAFAIAAQLLTGFASAAMVAGGDGLGRYVELQHRWSPTGQSRLVTESDSLPTGGRTDELHIQGDCDSFYVDSGEESDTWLLVERRSTVVRAVLDEDFRSSLALLATVRTDPEQRVWLQTDAEGNARVVMQVPTGLQEGPWFEVLPPYRIDIGLRDLSGVGYAEVSSTPGGLVGYLPTTSRDAGGVAMPVEIDATPGEAGPLARRGVRLQVVPGLDPPACETVRGSAASATAR